MSSSGVAGPELAAKIDLARASGMILRIGRNSRCYCGSGKKYKHCCIVKESPVAKKPEAYKVTCSCGAIGAHNVQCTAVGK